MRIFLQFKTHGPYPSCEKLKSGACTTPGTPEHPRTPRICQIRVRVFYFSFYLTARFLGDLVFLSVPECSGVFLCSDAAGFRTFENRDRRLDYDDEEYTLTHENLTNLSYHLRTSSLFSHP